MGLRFHVAVGLIEFLIQRVDLANIIDRLPLLHRHALLTGVGAKESSGQTLEFSILQEDAQLTQQEQAVTRNEYLYLRLTQLKDCLRHSFNDLGIEIGFWLVPE